MSQQINLFNPIFLKQKKHFSSRTMLQAMVLVVAVVAAVYGLQLYQLGTLRAQERTMRAQAQQSTQQMIGASTGKASKGLEDEIKRADSDLKTLQGISGAVETEVATGNEGFSRYLAAFARQPVSGLWLTGFTVTGNDLEVRGRALRADLLPAFIRKLSHEELLKGRGFAAVSVTARSAEPARSAPSQPAAAPQGPERFVEFSLATRDKSKEAQ